MEKSLIPISEIIKQGWQLYLDNFSKFFYPIIVSLIPYLLLYVVEYFNTPAAPILIIILTALSIVIDFWVVIVFMELIDKIYKKQTIEANKIYESAFKKIPSYFLVALLVGLITILGFILLIIPGIIFAVWYSFAVYINVLENKDNKGWTALKSSKELVTGRWGKTFWRLLLPSLLIYAIVLAVIIALMFMISGGQIDLISYEQSIIYNLITSVIFTILSPLFVAFILFLYYSLKETKEVKSEENSSQTA